MEVLHPRCCGLDIHKETVVACLRVVNGGKTVKEVRTFSTMTADLIALSQWLAEHKCTHIAMEATGIYWKPVWHILDDGEFRHPGNYVFVDDQQSLSGLSSGRQAVSRRPREHTALDR